MKSKVKNSQLFFEQGSVLDYPIDSLDVLLNYFSEQKKFNSVQKDWKEKVIYNEISKKYVGVLVTNMNQEIVYASDNLYKINGYFSHEIIGQTPKLFQGEGTSEETKNRIKKAILEKKPFKEVILNYKKDGTTYMCNIEAFPKFDKRGKLINYIAFEKLAS